MIGFTSDLARFEKLLECAQTLPVGTDKPNVVLGIGPSGHYWLNRLPSKRLRPVDRCCYSKRFQGLRNWALILQRKVIIRCQGYCAGSS